MEPMEPEPAPLVTEPVDTAAPASASTAAASSSDDTVMALDEPDTPTVIKLKAEDGTLFEIDSESALQSKLIASAVDDSSDDSGEVVIELKHVDAKTVEKVCEFLKYHSKVPYKDVPQPLPTANLNEVVSEWDFKFADVEQDLMFTLLLTANFMDIPSLLNLMAAKVASMLKGKTPEQVRETFNLRSDYTPEEEAEIRARYKDLLE